MPSPNFRIVTEQNLKDFRFLCQCLFPIAYPRSFYEKIKRHEIIAYIAYEERPIGCVAYQEASSKTEILVFGVLAQYRSRGVGSAMLDLVRDRTNNAKLSLHVQTDNELAMKFYQKRGFKQIKIEEDYYKRCQPSSAWVMERSDN